jgi:hypothetical protein
VRAIVVVALALVLAVQRYAHAKGCHEISDVVGIERCRRYGHWSRESGWGRAWVDLDFVGQHLAVPPYSLAGSPATPMTVGAVAQQRETTLNMYGYAQSVRYAFSRLFYTGFELGWGAASLLPVMPGAPTGATGDLFTHVIAGAHVERFRLGLAGELAVGPNLGDCSDRGCGGRKVVVRTDAEARVRLDLFLHPQFSLGVGYGQSLVTPDAHSLIIGLALHFRALDGMW